MDNPNGQKPEETLDPQDWESMRALSHQMVDDIFEYLETVRERPTWQPMPEDVRAKFKSPVPIEPEGAEAAYQDFTRDVLPYPMGNFHPRFWGWVIGSGTPMGMMAEMLAAALNPNTGGGDHSGNRVEEQVIDWLKEMLGYPMEASGLLLSGSSMANLICLTVARNTQAEVNVRKVGLGAAPRMIVYGSREIHSSIQRAVEVLGIGSDNLRLIPVNADFQMDLGALEAAIAQDKAAGLQPMAVIGSAGTVNTGAFDDLNALADICEREGIWLHVDGAFGAMAALSPESRHLTAGMERADSLGFDLHKWLYVPYEAACALVRNRDAHYNAFTLTPAYLAHTARGAGAGSSWFSDFGVELSRGFKALKVWMSIKENGTEKYGRMVQQNIEQATYLAGLVDAAPELERLAPVPLNIVCFRYRADGMDDAALNALNEELLIRLHESGVAVPTYTRINGKYAIRTAISNHRSRREDFDMLVEAVVKIGHELVGERVG
ncbi:MAG: pyridoxal-dependent decarboxylase [Chloroflexota bacterium]